MPMMQGAAATLSKVKPIDKETALATAYKLSGELPIDLRQWTKKKQDRSLGGIPAENNAQKSGHITQDPEIERVINEINEEKSKIEAIFKGKHANLSYRETVARNILAGTYTSSSRGDTPNSPHPLPDNGVYVKHEFEKDLIRGTARVNRARMKPEAFLSTNGVQAPIFLVEPRLVLLYEQEKTVRRIKTPGGGPKARTFAFGGQSLDEQLKPINIPNSKEELDRILNAKFVMDKKKMWLRSRQLHIERGKKELEDARIQAQLAKKSHAQRMRGLQERKRYVDEFRSKLKTHLEVTKDPMMGTIMRYVNEKVAWNILQQYKGFTMSMKAIVGLVGQTLGDLEITDEDGDLDQFGEAMASAVSNGINTSVLGNESIELPNEARLNADNFEGDNTYITSLPMNTSNKAKAFNDVEDDEGIDEGEVVMNDSVENSTIGDSSFLLNTAQRFIKPNSAGKIHARANVFAPGGAELAEKVLPHSTDLAVQKLGYQHSIRGSTPGSPNNTRTRISRAKKETFDGVVMPEISHTSSAKWNSDSLNPLNQEDKINIDQSSGTIMNVNKWHSNSGSRSNTPSATGHRGWNANTPTTRKMAGGFVVSVLDGRDAFYGVKDDLAPADSPAIKRSSSPNSPIKNESRRSNDHVVAEVTSPAANLLESSGVTASYSALVGEMTGLMSNGGIPYSENDMQSGSPNAFDERSENLAQAIESEKRALGTVPRLQPEKVLSDSHLEQLGKGQISFDSIATQMRWAKEKQQRQLQQYRQQQNQAVLKPLTSQSLGDLNSLTSMLDPPGGVGISVNQFANMDIELGFKPDPSIGGEKSPVNMTSSPQLISDLSRNLSRYGGSSNQLLDAKLDSNLFEGKKLVDASIRAPPKQLKSLAKSHPENPFKSFEEMTRVTNGGVAAGAGLSLALSDEARKARLIKWGQRAKSREGRYRVGGSSDTTGQAFSPDKKEALEERRRKISKMLS